MYDRNVLVQGLKDLSRADTIRNFHIGIPADTPRDVADNTYSVSWLVFFDSRDDHDMYQTDPVHLQFIAECSHLWERVVVFDTVNTEEAR